MPGFGGTEQETGDARPVCLPSDQRNLNPPLSLISVASRGTEYI